VEPDPDEGPRLSVNLDIPQAVLDGTPYSLRPDGATFVRKLLDAKGDWVSGTKFPDMRADRVRKRLPRQILELIEAKTGAGFRITRAKLA